MTLANCCTLPNHFRKILVMPLVNFCPYIFFIEETPINHEILCSCWKCRDWHKLDRQFPMQRKERELSHVIHKLHSKTKRGYRSTNQVPWKQFLLSWKMPAQLQLHCYLPHYFQHLGVEPKTCSQASSFLKYDLQLIQLNTVLKIQAY